MSKVLADGKLLMARQEDINAFFEENKIVGRVIADIRPSELDYMIQNIQDVEDFEDKRTECSIDTDGFICIIFEDGDNMEIHYSGEGPVILGFNTANLDEYPEYDGSCYSLRTMFQYCIGYKIVGIHTEKTDHRMTFPQYMGIDMSDEDEGVSEIRIALQGGSTLMASGAIDYFRFEHFMDFGGPICVKYSELISELNEETFKVYFEDWIAAEKNRVFEEDSWERFSDVEIDYDDFDNIEYGRFGFKDINGEVVIEPQYMCCSDFHHGLCAVAIKGPRFLASNGRKYNQELWGYIDKSGKAVIPFRFGRAQDFNKYGVAVVQDEWDDYEDFYLIDTKGNEIPGTRFRYIDKYYDYEERFLEFSNVDPGADNNMGLYDTKEKRVLIEPKTGGIIAWNDNFIKVSDTGYYGCTHHFDYYIDSELNELYPSLKNKGFNGVDKPDENGYAIVYVRSYYQADANVSSWNPIFGKKYRSTQLYGVASVNGNIVIPIVYDRVRRCDDGSFECVKDDKTETIKL